MNTELLQIKSTFSTPYIFLIYLGINPDEFYNDEHNCELSIESRFSNNIYDINQILLYRVMHLDEHEEIIPSPIYDKLTKRQIEAAFKICKSLESDCSNNLLSYIRYDEEDGSYILTRENIYEWFNKHRYNCPKELQSISDMSKWFDNDKYWEESNTQTVFGICGKIYLYN